MISTNCKSMYSKWQLARKYISHYFSAYSGKGHGIHSPFVYDFVRTVLQDRDAKKTLQPVEDLRRKLCHDPREILVEDLGAGSAHDKQNKRRVASIAKHAAKSPALCRLLHSVVKRYKPETIIELGTSLGLSGSAMMLGKAGTRLITIEGASAVAEIASENFKSLGLNNIEQIRGDFDQVLPGLISSGKKCDLVFIDGNHRYEPTVRYFKMILQSVHAETIIIFDDIHWSDGMEKAWDEIRKNPSVTCSIDLFFMGMIFFRPEFREKQDFRIRF